MIPGGRNKRADERPNDRPRTEEQGRPHEIPREPEVPLRLRVRRLVYQ